MNIIATANRTVPGTVQLRGLETGVTILLINMLNLSKVIKLFLLSFLSSYLCTNDDSLSGRVGICLLPKDFYKRIKKNRNILSRIITTDETCLHYYEPAKKLLRSSHVYLIQKWNTTIEKTMLTFRFRNF